MTTIHTPGPMVVDNYTAEIPFRVYSIATHGNVGLFFSAGDANLFAASTDMLTALQALVTTHPFKWMAEIKNLSPEVRANRPAISALIFAAEVIAQAKGGAV